MKKIISVLLCAVMLLSAFSCIVFAQDKLNYVVLGDSIARGAGIYNSDEACFGRIVANTNGYNYKNYGIDGYTSWQLVDYIRTDDVTASIKDADIISLSIGGNDYLQQNVPLLIYQVTVGDFKIVNDIQDNYRENFADIIGYIKEINPDVVIIAQTLYNPRTDLIKNAYGEATKRITEVVTDYAANNPGVIEVVDTIPVIEGKADCVALDGIHPSAVGNEELAKLVLQKLYDLGLGENTEPVITVNGVDQIPGASRIFKLIREFFEKIKAMFTSL